MDEPLPNCKCHPDDVDDNAMAQVQWLTCGDDAAVFPGAAGAGELKGNFAGAIAAVKQDWDGERLDLNKEGQPPAYVFRRLLCKQFLAYVDRN